MTAQKHAGYLSRNIFYGLRKLLGAASVDSSAEADQPHASLAFFWPGLRQQQLQGLKGLHNEHCDRHDLRMEVKR